LLRSPTLSALCAKRVKKRKILKSLVMPCHNEGDRAKQW
jgi:hypothetical protein